MTAAALRSVPAFLLALCLPAAVSPAGEDVATDSAAAPAPPAPRGDEALARRAAALAREGEAGLGILRREAGAGRPGVRRAALRALATPAAAGAEGPSGALTLRVCIEALAATDPAVREAAIPALVACGEPAVEALRALAGGTPPAAGPHPRVPAPRARDALHELLRRRIEGEFLGLWGADDGSFHGMFAALKPHGDFAARVLTAIALDRRMAGTDDLGFGPYVWRCPPDGTRERSDVRHRALDALGDAGNEEARETLRSYLRRTPAPRRFSDRDFDPVPAALDDAMRMTIAALGDPGPLVSLIQVIRGNSGNLNSFWEVVEGSRAAAAHIQLGRTATDRTVRREHFDAALDIMESAMQVRQRDLGQGNDATDHYNLACVLAQRDAPGDRDRAIRHLGRCVDIDPIRSDWMLRDGDLENVRGMAAFQDLVREVRAREAAAKAGPR